MEPKAKKPPVDWEAVEREYCFGLRTLKDIGAEFGVSDAGIIKRAKRDGWVRDLSSKIRAKPPVLKVAKDPLVKPGFVYVICIEDTAGDRFYKIGMDSSFPSRAQSHQTSSPFTILVACAYYVGNMRKEEKILHAMFESSRVRGEWFKLSDSDLDCIAARSRLL